MRLQPLLIALTVVNLAAVAVAQSRPSQARPSQVGDIAPVLRGRALEIVDARGRPRATITLMPGDPSYKMPDGTVGYPETILFRLIDQHGRPNVKIEASEDGGGVGLGGKDAPTYARLAAKGPTSSLQLTNGDAREQRVAP